MKNLTILKFCLMVFFVTQFFSCGGGKDDLCNYFRVSIVQEGPNTLKTNVQDGNGPYDFKWSNGLGNFDQIVVSETGIYKVTVTDLRLGCSAFDSINFKAPSSNGCGPFTTVLDSENNQYDIVTIGDQCWMKTNVNLESGIAKINDFNEWSSTQSPAWCYYENDVNNGPKYQKLYNWYAVKSGKLCPQGWHIPTMAEWEKLIKFLGGDSLALAAMIKNDPLWKAGTTPNNNQSQFSALPGGRRQENGSFIYEGTDAYFWASDESSPGSTQAILLRAKESAIFRLQWKKIHGFSCRCLKD
ncbi:MAG: FISUMP domain-containing protein [Saprospiraceae bacterium]